MTVPPGIPWVLSQRAVVAALHMTTQQVRHLLDSEQLPHIPRDAFGWRCVQTSQLVIFANKCQLNLDWDAVLEVIN